MSSTIKGKWLDEEIFDDCMMNIEESVRFSTKWSFALNEFWGVLPPQIQNKIVDTVLKRQVRLLDHFFNDKIMNVSAPHSFITSVMVNLESSLYDVGDVIVSHNEKVNDLIFIQSGSVELCGIHSVKVLNLNKNIYQRSTQKGDAFFDEEEEQFRIRVVRLREGSWYGDF